MTSPAPTPGQIEIETVDITVPAQITALHDRLADRMFDLLFVNAGVTNRPEGTVAQTSTEEFIRVMVTNALSPLRVVETLQDRVEPAGMIGVMSSGQGSVANNERGGHEVYRGSKAALNTFMRSYAARHSGERRTLVLMAPGWVRPSWAVRTRGSASTTASRTWSGRSAPFGRPGLHYVDYLGRTVPG